eukprot:14253232-Heterocapsa_arctica.AAC.1
MAAGSGWLERASSREHAQRDWHEALLRLRRLCLRPGGQPWTPGAETVGSGDYDAAAGEAPEQA